jgi:hypothetical protein
MFRFQKICLLVLGVLLFQACLFPDVYSHAIDLRIRPESAHDIIITKINEVWQLETTGSDPFVVTELSGKLISDNEVLEFEYLCVEPIKNPSIYFGPPITAANKFDLPTIRQAEGWYKYTADLTIAYGKKLPQATRVLRIDLGSKPGVTIQVRNLKLRPRTEKEIESIANGIAIELQKKEAAERITKYLASTSPATIESVHMGKETVTVKSKSADPNMIPNLVEIPIENSIGEQKQPLPVDFTHRFVDGRIEMEFPRRIENRDRLHSGFVLVLPNNSEETIAHRTFATSFDPPAVPVAIPPKPRNQKGLSGVSDGPESDLKELGITAVTMNLVLNRFVTETNGPKRELIPVDGKPIYFNHDAFAGIDHLTKLSRRNDIVVSAILLIVNKDSTGPKSTLIHPEADGGVYAMPDLTTSRGAGIYAFVLDKLAERYRDPTSELGGITNWIAHNEVDFHSVWTNLGKQPRPIATETYYRSMRMIHNTARMYQPNARVFASLTHHWVQPDDGSGRQLSPREVIETLQRYSTIEGDFAWGVAYHPYPESLFAKVAWEDKKPTDSFDTPLITIQNLPVLARFLEQALMRDSQGNVRPVILSEQGFHTADNSEEAQQAQAQSLIYAMKKVRSLPIVESFHYHRWLDHPDEGGLHLGLRTEPTSTQPFGTKKQAWEAYRKE